MDPDEKTMLINDLFTAKQQGLLSLPGTNENDNQDNDLDSLQSVQSVKKKKVVIIDPKEKCIDSLPITNNMTEPTTLLYFDLFTYKQLLYIIFLTILSIIWIFINRLVIIEYIPESVITHLSNHYQIYISILVMSGGFLMI